MTLSRSAQFSLENVNKAGSVVNVERLRWINSRHVRALFADDSIADAKKQDVINGVLPFISSSLPAEVVGQDLVASFGVAYIWKAMDLMKVQNRFLLAYSSSLVADYGYKHFGLILEGTRERAARVWSTLRAILRGPRPLECRGAGHQDQVHRRRYGCAFLCYVWLQMALYCLKLGP